ncbi:MAG TPA: hypothetical protein PK228_12850 [Saprospiraceae bacterium]|nr:hypothetical protein [Saprospiraceae bacterium]
MKLKHLLLFSIILLFAAQAAQSQSGTDKINADHDRANNVNALEREAEKAVAKGDDYTAMVFYRNVLEYDSLRMPALERYGDAAMRFSAYEQAEIAYERLVGRGMTTADGMQLVKLAESKFHLGKYQEAKELYRRFLYIETPVGITQEVLENAQTGLENCDWAFTIAENSDPNAPLDTLKEINSMYADFAPYPKNGTLFYSSARFEFEKDKNYPKRRLAKTLYGTLQPGDTLKSAMADFNVENKHTANVTFNDKGDVMYYTVCDYIEKTANIRCDIYMRKMTGSTWGQPVKLPPHINYPDSTNTEPTVGRAPGDSTEILYFVSNRPGGKGRRDIWYSRISGDNFSQPVNLAAINTTENDITPFYHNGTGTLYFSTDGLQTIGGFDIYRAKGHDDVWDEPVHMGMPINSPSNDAYFAVSKNGKTSYFASNRKGSTAFKAEDKREIPGEQACCYDIYRIALEKPVMIAVTFNKLTGDSLQGTTLQLVEYSSKGVAVEERKVKVDGAFFGFDLQPRRSYMIIATKPRFTSDTVRFETPPTIWKDTLVERLYLQPAKPHLIVTVFDKKTGEPIIGAKVRFLTLGMRMEGGTFATGKGGGPLEMLERLNAESNRFEYPIEFEHRYRAMAFKPGYTRDSTDDVSTEGLIDAITLERKIYLTKGVTFTAHTLNAVTRDTLYGVTYKLREIEGGDRFEQYVNPPGVKNFETLVDYERQYIVIASKDGFTSDSVRFTTKDLPKTEAFHHIERELRLRPLTIAAYLPIRLFFDNDEPDKRSTKTTTDREYRPTYVDFYRRKPEFLEKYAEGLAGAEKQAAIDSIESFFEREVRAGWEKLFFFSEDLYKMMERGDYIVLTLRGFASPRAAAQYNMNLTARRVASVRNHFLKHDGAIYKRFVDNGQIVIKLEPNGENLAPKDISDDPKDLRRSIYDPRASRERRLEIIGVEVKRGTNGI